MAASFILLIFYFSLIAGEKTQLYRFTNILKVDVEIFYVHSQIPSQGYKRSQDSVQFAIIITQAAEIKGINGL